MIRYRQMTPEDVPVISKLAEEAFSMPWSPEDFRQMIEKDTMWQRKTESC